jgi:hypothetical protein
MPKVLQRSPTKHLGHTYSLLKTTRSSKCVLLYNAPPTSSSNTPMANQCHISTESLGANIHLVSMNPISIMHLFVGATTRLEHRGTKRG